MPSFLKPVATLLAAVAPALMGQGRDPRPAGDVDPVAAASYVNTSLEAEEQIARAEKHAAPGRWSTAARTLQEIADRFGDYVIEAEPRCFVSIRDFVNRKVSAWPPDGVAAYRRIFGPAADAALRSALHTPDFDALVRLADRYFPTAAAARALDAAAELAAERADFQSARRWYARLIADHPDRDMHHDDWSAKLALVALWDRDPMPLTRLLDSPDFHPAALRWGASSQQSIDFLRRWAAAGPDVFGPQPLDTPCMLMGGPDRRGFFACQADVEAQLWRFSDMPKSTSRGPLVEADDALNLLDAHERGAQERMLESGVLLASMPVEGQGLIFAHDASSAWAVRPDQPEKAVWRYNLVEKTTSDPPSTSDDDSPPLYTALYDAGRLYLHFQNSAAGEDQEGGRIISSLVCLDAANGRPLWRNDLEAFATAFEQARLDGAPILHQGSLFAVARRRKSFGFEACFLLRLDPRTGELLATVHLGEAATGSYGYHRATISHPAAAGDLIITPTNLGVVSAVSAASGRIAWIHRYASAAGDGSDSIWPDRVGRPVRSWHYQPALIWRDSLVCMPLDIEHILVLRQDDGAEQFKIPLAGLDNAETILGIQGDLLYTVGAQVVCFDLLQRIIVWQRPLATGQLLGRGALTTSGLFVPTDRALLRYPLDGGPAQTRPWPIESAGNILPLPDQLVVASPGSLFGLVGKNDAIARLTRRMEQAPGDPVPALSLARLAFETRDFERGLAAVQEAVDRLGGFARLHDDALRRRLFDSLMQFAAGLVARHQPDRDSSHDPADAPRADPGLHPLSVAAQLLVSAGQCAPGAQELLIQRLQLARVHIMARRFDEAIAAYQQVLGDRGLRRLTLRLQDELRPPLGPRGDASRTPFGDDEPFEDQQIAHAGDLVANWIDAVVREAGPEVYASTENQAIDRLKIARANSEPSALLEITEAFPNSSAAATAFAAYARAMNDRQDAAAAEWAYRRALTDDRHPDHPALIREWADVLFEAGRLAECAQWLNRGLRAHPNHRLRHQGKPVGFQEYRRLLLDDQSFIEPSRAIAFVPIEDSYKRLYPDRVNVLQPANPTLPQTHWDSLITYAAGQIDARSPTTGRSVWPRPLPCDTQPQLLGMNDAEYIFATPRHVFALTRGSGQRSWQFGDETPDLPRTDPESLPAWTNHVLTADRLYSASDRGEMVCVELKEGAVRWRLRVESPGAELIVADDRFLCYTAWQGRELVVSIIDAATGRTVTSFRPRDGWPIRALALAADHRLLILRSASVECITLPAAESVWEISSPQHFAIASLQLDADGLFIANDRRRTTKYDLYDGRPLWSLSRIGSQTGAQPLWTRLVGGSLLAASEDRIAAFDVHDGKPLWQARCPGCMTVQPPCVLANEVVVITETAQESSHREPAPNGGDPKSAGTPYRILAFDLNTGAKKNVREGGPLLTEPISAFAGLFCRDRSLIILDGSRLIGFTGPSSHHSNVRESP